MVIVTIVSEQQNKVFQIVTLLQVEGTEKVFKSIKLVSLDDFGKISQFLKKCVFRNFLKCGIQSNGFFDSYPFQKYM